MPKLFSAVSEVDTHILNPTVKQLSNKILTDLNLKKIVGDNIFIDTGYTALQHTHQRNHKSLVRQNQFKVNADININPFDPKWGNANNYTSIGYGIFGANISRDYDTIFKDPGSGIYLSEFSVPTTITLQCSILLVDRPLAYEIAAMIYRSYIPDHVRFEHIAYDYPIPKDLCTMLFSLYNLKRSDKQTKFKDNNTFKAYLQDNSNKYINFMVNRTLDRKELVASKTYINCTTMCDYSENKPTEVKVNKLVTQYEIQFNYTLQFPRPDMLVLTYPHVLDNQLIPPQMLKQPTIAPIQSLDGPWDPVHLSQPGYIHRTTHFTPVVFPFYDDWIIPRNNAFFESSYKPFMIASTLMDETNEYTVEDLHHFDDEYKLHPVVSAMLEAQGMASFHTGAFIHAMVYNNNYPILAKDISLDDKLNLKIYCTDISKTRRIVLSIATDLKYVDDIWKDKLEDLIGKEDFDKLLDTGDNNGHITFRSLFGLIIARRQAIRN